MTELPIKLNFFHDAETFVNLRRLDKQWQFITKNYSLKVQNKIPLTKKARGLYYNADWPTWNVEKKILRAIFADYKYFNILITKDLLKNEDFLIKINPSAFLLKNKKLFYPPHEISCSGPEYVIKNLVAHGFADERDSGNVVINKSGLEVGAFIFRIYKFQEGEQGDKGEPIIELLPKYSAKIGYNLLLFSAISFIIYSFGYLIISLLSSLKLFDNFYFIIISVFRNSNYFLLIQDFITIILFLPILFFITAILFIWSCK